MQSTLTKFHFFFPPAHPHFGKKRCACMYRIQCSTDSSLSTTCPQASNIRRQDNVTWCAATPSHSNSIAAHLMKACRLRIITIGAPKNEAQRVRPVRSAKKMQWEATQWRAHPLASA